MNISELEATSNTNSCGRKFVPGTEFYTGLRVRVQKVLPRSDENMLYTWFKMDCFITVCLRIKATQNIRVCL